MRVSILDEGKASIPHTNWREDIVEDFALWVDDEYIGSGTFDDENKVIIMVSTLHKVEFRRND